MLNVLAGQEYKICSTTKLYLNSKWAFDRWMYSIKWLCLHFVRQKLKGITRTMLRPQLTPSPVIHRNRTSYFRLPKTYDRCSTFSFQWHLVTSLRTAFISHCGGWNPGNHLADDSSYTSPTASLDASEKTNIVCPFQKCNPNPSVIQPIVQSLYWLTYLGHE
jgi:hypothetical protein